MCKEFKIIVTSLIFLICSLFTYAQQVNTSYFLENSPTRHYLNPSFQPLNNFYIGMPILGFSQMAFGNNSLALKDLIYKTNGQTISFLGVNGNKTQFYNNLKSNTLFYTDFQVNLLDFGFRHNNAYWTFSLSQKADAGLNLPKELFKFFLFGTPDIDSNNFNFSALGLNASVYTEVALGYSKKVDDIWSVGGKLKLLLGNSNVSAENNNITLNANMDEWLLKANGTMNVASAVDLNGTSFDTFDPISPSKVSDYFKPAGYGAGIDLGVTVKPTENLTVSAALLDLGFINWKKNTNNIDYNLDYEFNGVTNVDLESDYKWTTISDSILTEIGNAFTDTTFNKKYSSHTIPKLNVGVEYGFLDNRLSAGLLSRTYFRNNTAFEELTVSVNGKPTDWFNMSLSYSTFNGKFNNIGAGIGLRTGFVHWLISADYIPLSYSSLPVTIDIAAIGKNDYKIPVPYNSKGLNLAIGVNFVFGNRQDADKDGVVDKKDKCPDTPFGVIVDKDGCPVDTDGDGVPDYLDKCPNTPVEAYSHIDQNGCPKDDDKDSVPNYLDKCPDTPAEAIGFVDSIGCELDTDIDGVPDYRDKCPDTPLNLAVDSLGCSADTDGDGVLDYKDLCENTPIEAKGKVDENGCPEDKDVDGVLDYLDLCPDTPFELRGLVNKDGCDPDAEKRRKEELIENSKLTSKDNITNKNNTTNKNNSNSGLNVGSEFDADSDNVPDSLDKCLNTPLAARGMVDKNGCPLDSDGDGIYDYLDSCPDVAGAKENNGCPDVKKDVRNLLQKALQGICFEFAQDVIMPHSYRILNQIAGVLIANPTYMVEIRGHADDIGNTEFNLDISKRRATAVKKYLVSKGVSADRMTTNGYGESLPLESNGTVNGRAQNRRVEFIVTFEEITFE